MKHLLLIGFAFLTLNATAQIDSVKNAVQVQPLIINALNKDTIYQARVENMWGSPYDTSINTHVVVYDRKGKNVGERNVILPYSFLVAWTNKSMVDNYILTFLGLKKK